MNTVNKATKAEIRRENNREKQERRILSKAASAFRQQDVLQRKLRRNEQQIRDLCRQFDRASGTHGFGPQHLRKACEKRELLS